MNAKSLISVALNLGEIRKSSALRRRRYRRPLLRKLRAAGVDVDADRGDDGQKHHVAVARSATVAAGTDTAAVPSRDQRRAEDQLRPVRSGSESVEQPGRI